MGITIIAIIAIILGFVLMKTEWEDLGFGIILAGIITFATCVILIIGGHICIDMRIEKNRVQHDSLCKRLEIVTTEYEDVSKSDVIKDIAEWNKEVLEEKYWAYNPWTNWFHSKRVADNMQYIEEQEE